MYSSLNSESLFRVVGTVPSILLTPDGKDNGYTVDNEIMNIYVLRKIKQIKFNIMEYTQGKLLPISILVRLFIFPISDGIFPSKPTFAEW